MVYDPERHHRRSVRLKGYDYTSVGVYYITLCTHQREDLLGEILGGEMHCNIHGRITASCWGAIAEHWPNVQLDAFVVMPNHIHGIIVITDAPAPSAVGAGSPRPPALRPLEANTGAEGVGAEGEETSSLRQEVRRPALGAIVAYMKYQSTKRINEARGTPAAPVWQRSYHDRIVRDERMWENARRYIANNPAKWSTDINNPNRLPQQ